MKTCRKRLKRGFAAAAAAVMMVLLPGSSFHVSAGGYAISAEDRDQIGQLYIESQQQYAAEARAKEEERKLYQLEPVVIRVSQDGDGDYTTIQAAVNAAHNGDIIEIAPGIYHENVKNCYKTLALIGMGNTAEDVVLEGSSNDYFHAPLDMGTGILRNMTIHGVDDGSSEGTLCSYALHCDFESEQDSTFYVENVNFINDINTAVGLGTKLNYSVTFKNCRFESKTSAPALFMHDYEAVEPYQQPLTQHVTLENCFFTSRRVDPEGAGPDSAVIELDSRECCNKAAKITFIDNTLTLAGEIKREAADGETAAGTAAAGDGDDQSAPAAESADGESTTAGDPGVIDWTDGGMFKVTHARGRLISGQYYCGTSDWVLTDDSEGNNVEVLNADVLELIQPQALEKAETAVVSGNGKTGSSEKTVSGSSTSTKKTTTTAKKSSSGKKTSGKTTKKTTSGKTAKKAAK